MLGAVPNVAGVVGTNPVRNPRLSRAVLASCRIDWCEAAGNYVRLRLRDESHLFRETMNGLESKLDPRHFARIHRSTIVNVERIEELRSSLGGECMVFLRDGTKLTLSRGYREGFQERFGKSL